jgi:hypothetical protein
MLTVALNGELLFAPELSARSPGPSTLRSRPEVLWLTVGSSLPRSLLSASHASPGLVCLGLASEPGA